MANVNAPAGFIPRRHGKGGVIRTNEYQIVGALASNIYRGSAVKPVNTSKRIDVAAAGDRMAGIFKGCSYTDAAGGVQFQPKWLSGTALKAGSSALAEVYDDPDILFQVQMSGTPGAVATDIGNFADALIGTGNATTGTSGDMLNQASLGTTDGGFRIEELDSIQANDFGQYAKVLVRFNEHQLNSPATTDALTAI